MEILNHLQAHNITSLNYGVRTHKQIIDFTKKEGRISLDFDDLSKLNSVTLDGVKHYFTDKQWHTVYSGLILKSNESEMVRENDSTAVSDRRDTLAMPI